MFDQAVAILNPDHEKVIHALSAVRLVRKLCLLFPKILKQISVTRSRRTAPLGPLWEVFEFCVQNTGLDSVKPAIVAFDFVVILFRLAMVTQHAHSLG